MELIKLNCYGYIFCNFCHYGYASSKWILMWLGYFFEHKFRVSIDEFQEIYCDCKRVFNLGKYATPKELKCYGYAFSELCYKDYNIYWRSGYWIYCEKYGDDALTRDEFEEIYKDCIRLFKFLKYNELCNGNSCFTFETWEDINAMYQDSKNTNKRRKSNGV